MGESTLAVYQPKQGRPGGSSSPSLQLLKAGGDRFLLPLVISWCGGVLLEVGRVGMGTGSSVLGCLGASGSGKADRWSARFKAVSPFSSFSTSGANSKSIGRDVSGASGCSSRVSRSFAAQTPRSEGEILQSPSLKSFSLSDLKTCTRNFRPDSVLGEGGFGSVFKGWIDENSLTAARPGRGMTIAVKRLNQDGFQGHREWLAEVNYLGQLHHLNLVKLIGYCLEDEHRLLVYEFITRGSLENYLFRRGSNFRPLSWSLRLKVALGAAKGLAFLHSAETSVIYRDFKTSNILLDENYNAKLSDFGLAKDGPTGDKSYVSTKIMGTYGYTAPEYLATGHLTAKSNVYSFGVLLLEMLSGRRAIDKNRPSGQHNLVEWAKPYLTSKRKILRVIDSRLEGQYSLINAMKVALLVLHCLSLDSRRRPRMDEVVKSLEKLQEAGSWSWKKHSETAKETPLECTTADTRALHGKTFASSG